MFFKALFKFFSGDVDVVKLNEQGKRLIIQGRDQGIVDEKSVAKAIALFKKVLHHEDDNIEALINLGAVLCDMGNFGMALEVLKKAESLGADDANLYYNLGAAMMHLTADQTKAHFYFKKAGNQSSSSNLRAAYVYQSRG